MNDKNVTTENNDTISCWGLLNAIIMGITVNLVWGVLFVLDPFKDQLNSLDKIQRVIIYLWFGGIVTLLIYGTIRNSLLKLKRKFVHSPNM